MQGLTYVLFGNPINQKEIDSRYKQDC
ncbi:MAG: hypothetical protein ACO2ZZ_12935 [Cyclobacteriaceae bacterium]